MPTYEYRCSAGHQFEQFQRMSEPPLESCPQCGAPAERQMSAGVGLLFKGSGFYITDYRSDSYRKAAEADQGGSPEKGAGAPAAGGEGGAKPASSAEGGAKTTSSEGGASGATKSKDSGAGGASDTKAG